MSRKSKLVPGLILTVLLLITGSSVISADGPNPPEAFEPTEPIITQSTKLEWVAVQTDDGTKRILIPVTFIESVQTVTVPKASAGKEGGASEVMVGSITVTLWRGMGYYPNGNANDPDTLWNAWSQARTSTDQCVDQVNAWAGHKWKAPSTGWKEDTDGENVFSSGPCHDDSGIAQSGDSQYQSGTEHLSHGVHVTYINGDRHPWDQTGPGPLTLP